MGIGDLFEYIGSLCSIEPILCPVEIDTEREIIKRAISYDYYGQRIGEVRTIPFSDVQPLRFE